MEQRYLWYADEQQWRVQPGRECGGESVMQTCTEGGRGWRDGVGIPECVAMWALAEEEES